MTRIAFDAATVEVGGRVLLHPLTLDLTERRVAVIGANGSGKSTLLKLVDALQEPTAGTVRVDDLDTRASPAAVRARVGFVFTDPAAQLIMPTLREDVVLSLRRSVPRRDRATRADQVLARFGLTDLADRSVFDLSAGERQLGALAVVLAVDPAVLVLDEPSTLLDLRNTLLLRRTLEGLDQQVLLSTHDLDLAASCERVLVLEGGRVIADDAGPAAVAFYRRRCDEGLRPGPSGTAA
ncbi:energy-coupling factor ABC transporter ATP-binding protein [Tersicoccus sp. Bi-70]|uniref:energy-coupling factor ABC transporter ATP-binding protein n=1 Tax=Tersicoccus sp. Bi-70 TaxID=1897634 RepID=UPI000975C629|nr:ABC transporter ATP-binding protein [Tersicoccus sp. Bi-70]OMH33050.1 cobalt ABC transporter ATP-binding protein [Tersicoccus sp. Bi-70]